MADTRTDAYGKFRIALTPGTYRVGAASTKLTYPSIRPRTAIVPLGRYARVSFAIDIGIR